MDTVVINTTSPVEALDITDLLPAPTAGDEDGFAVVMIRHTSAALVLGPADEGMLLDYVKLGESWFAEHRPFKHIENNNPNGEAHLLSSFIGTSLLVPLREGKLDLGKWQRVLLLEFDGPAARTVEVRTV